jgi:hypothetical protein
MTRHERLYALLVEGDGLKERNGMSGLLWLVTGPSFGDNREARGP